MQHFKPVQDRSEAIKKNTVGRLLANKHQARQPSDKDICLTGRMSDKQTLNKTIVGQGQTLYRTNVVTD